MNPVYFDTRFAVESESAEWPESFAIITAHATTGETWSEEENRVADMRLERKLRERGVWMLRATGYSPQTGHAEPGWAVALGFDAACNLGQQFKQEAIYYVMGDALYVSYCDARRKLEPVGGFRARLVSGK